MREITVKCDICGEAVDKIYFGFDFVFPPGQSKEGIELDLCNECVRSTLQVVLQHHAKSAYIMNLWYMLMEKQVHTQKQKEGK